MNVRINYDRAIYDGTELVFRSPVDCSQVTGLIVYYPLDDTEASKEFAFADAHGNNVGDIDHLFAENVVVKVILDVTSGMAFVQNADTNAYIENTFIKSVNGVKPDSNGNVNVSGSGEGPTSPGESGATFTPSVSADGVISWTNDKGLSNPTPVNIKGPKGDDGNTPKRGTDYWTASDIAEIKSYVDDAILGGEW